MGANCIGCTTPMKKKPKYSKQPSDISDFDPEKLNYKLKRLTFKGEIQNVQLMNYPYEIVWINFKIHHSFECSLPRQKKGKSEFMASNSNDYSLSNKIKWKFETSFLLKMTEYQIRKSFIRILIFKQQANPIIQQHLNLYQIITGPYHHDIALNFQNKQSARLTFDLKISQKFFILINPLEVSVHLNQDFPGEQFNYSFNAYSSGQKISSSDGSLPEKVSIFSNAQGNYRQVKPEDQCQSPTRIRKGSNASKMIKNLMTSELKWSKPKQVVIKSAFRKKVQQNSEEEIVMPSFRMELSSNQLKKSSIQFVLWRIEWNKTINNNQAILYGDCYISFPKIFQSDYLYLQQLQTDSSQEEQQHVKKVMKKFQNRVCILQEPLIRQGKSVGRIVLKLKVINEIFFSQMSLHARTEDGVVYMNSMLKNYFGKDRTFKQTQNTRKIQSTFDRIINLLYSINQEAQQKRRNWTQFNKMENKAVMQFEVLVNLLNASLEESYVLGRKHNLQQIIEKQNIFLGIIQKLHIFLEEQNVRFVQQIWKVLILMMKRGQFYLQNIGFSQFQVLSCSGDRENQASQPYSSIVYPKKVRTALRYQQILYKVLILALNFNYESQRDTIIQVQAFKAYGYFRVPKFREQILKSIARNDQNLNLEEIHHQFVEESKVADAMMKFQEKSSSHLDWEKYFYSYLKNEKKSIDLNLMIVHKFQHNSWFDSLAERKQSFYLFIEYFSKKMAELGKRLKLIKYSYCPGYNKLVKAFLCEMKKKPLVQYESCMIESCTALLTNQNLINIIIQIVVQKTNLYDSMSIGQFLNILSNFLKYLTENGTKTIPWKFNHPYFFKIIKLILQSEYSYGISKMLVILHTYFECFNDQFKDVLCLYLLSRAFFRLFFHWSFSIRIIFYHLFIIKIYWSKLNGVTQKFNKMDTYRNDNCQIYNRYKKLIKILNAAQRQRNTKKKNMKRAERQEYYMKMKKKIAIRLREQNPQIVKNINESGFDSQSEHSAQKQQTLNLNRLQTLCQLKDGYNRSQTLCSTQIKQHLRKIQSTKASSDYSQFDPIQRQQTLNEKQQTEEVDTLGINLKIKNQKRISENIKKNENVKNEDTDLSVKEEIQKLNEDYIKKLCLNSRKSSSNEQKPLVYTFFGNEDYQLEDISLNQENKILMGMEEFRQTQEFVEKYILQKGVAPHVNLDPQIELDSNEFKVLEFNTV